MRGTLVSHEQFTKTADLPYLYFTCSVHTLWSSKNSGMKSRKSYPSGILTTMRIIFNGTLLTLFTGYTSNICDIPVSALSSRIKSNNEVGRILERLAVN